MVDFNKIIVLKINISNIQLIQLGHITWVVIIVSMIALKDKETHATQPLSRRLLVSVWKMEYFQNMQLWLHLT